MNDFGNTLTLTGGIATLLSVLFASAALYVQHKRRNNDNIRTGKKDEHKGTSPGSLLPVDKQPLDQKPQIKKEPVVQEVPSIGRPVFKQYSPGVPQDGGATNSGDNSYAWE